MKSFPMRWDEWCAGIQGAYEFLEHAERRRAAGQALNPEGQDLEEMFKQVDAKYHRNGRRKPQLHEHPTSGSDAILLPKGPLKGGL